MDTRNGGYSEKLAREWIDWIGRPDADGSREREIIPYVGDWLARTAPSRLADIGCGQGDLSRLVSETTDYVGIDPSEFLVREARARYTGDRKEFFIGTAEDIPLPDSSADAAISVWVWSHLADPALAARETARILRVGGRFLVVTANPGTYGIRESFYREYRIDGDLLTGTFELGEGRILSDSTLYLHTAENLRSAIAGNGLVLEKESFLAGSDARDALYVVFEGSLGGTGRG